MAKVKGSPQYRMKVVPHRPVRNLFLWLLLGLLILGAIVATYGYAQYRANQLGMSPEAAAKLRTERDQMVKNLASLRQQLTQAQMNAEVDRKASEDLRQRLLERREQIAQLEREVSVYRMMSARTSRNPMGISFGTFSVKPVDNSDLYHMKLVVQKLAEGDDEFEGLLESTLVGKQGGTEQKLPLVQLVVTPEGGQPLADKIPVDFKYFQNIEADLRLPEGFEPERMDVKLVSSSRRNPLVVEQQLEWVQADD